LTQSVSWDQGTTAVIKMPQFLEQTGYCQPEDHRTGLFQYSFWTDKDTFEYWAGMPAVMDNFNMCMTGIRGSRPNWIEWSSVIKQFLDSEKSVK
jgi:hypothetical protein